MRCTDAPIATEPSENISWPIFISRTDIPSCGRGSRSQSWDGSEASLSHRQRANLSVAPTEREVQKLPVNVITNQHAPLTPKESSRRLQRSSRRTRGPERSLRRPRSRRVAPQSWARWTLTSGWRCPSTKNISCLRLSRSERTQALPTPMVRRGRDRSQTSSPKEERHPCRFEKQTDKG